MKKIIKKKVLPLILATTLVLPFIPSNSFADNGADLFNSVSSPAKETTTIFTIGKTDFTIDNKSKIMDAAPIIHKGRTMVPMKYAAESVGADIVWLPKEETAKITLGSRKVSLSLKSNILLINGEKIKMDVEPMIMNGRMFIPVSYIAKAFDLNVKWDEKSQTITMNGSKNEWNGKIDNPAKDPVPSPLVETNEKIFSGVHSTFILTSKGNVKSFGNDSDGRLGNGAGQDEMLGNWVKDNQKVQVKNVKEVSVFNGHTMFLVNNGDVYSY